MNYKKLILVGCISAFVAVLTSILGVAGTVIGSVVSSVLYNMLSEALEQPVQKATLSHKFEWEVAYVFPLVVIALIQLLFIFALLSQWGILPHTFLNAFLSLQHLAANNLYRLLGFAMIVISVYPLVIKPGFIKKSHAAIIAFVGLIFLARGFVDLGITITNVYDIVFAYFDFPIAIIALSLIVFVIYKILISRESEKDFDVASHKISEQNHSYSNAKMHNHSRNHDDVDYIAKRKSIRVKNHEPVNESMHKREVKSSERLEEKSRKRVNQSSGKIQFESNDLLDDYKK